MQTGAEEILRAWGATVTGAELAKLELSVRLLAERGVIRLRLRGSSMFPAIRPGDIVTAENGHAGVNEGDILLFLRGTSLYAHRVIGFADDRLVTRGDALVAPDCPVSREELCGRIVRIQRLGREFAPPRRPPAYERAIAALCRRSNVFHRIALLLWAARLKLAKDR